MNSALRRRKGGFIVSQVLLGIGILIVLFVGYNIGGACIGPAFGPAIGSNAISKVTAAVFMALCFSLGAWTIGRRVVDTLGNELITEPELFTIRASLAILLFIGLALFSGNYLGVPASTSMTAVGAIVGMGLAQEALNWAVIGEILTWWILSPAIGFWVSLVIGRYFYSYLNRVIALDDIESRVLVVKWWKGIPLVGIAPDSNRSEVIGAGIVVGIGGIMAFSSGASNIANAIAPLVGSGSLAMNPAIIIGCTAVTIGALTIGRRTLETLGNDLTELPLTASVVVATVSATLVIILSALGIPVSFVVIATVCIIGLGWGRATRPIPARGVVTGETSGDVSINSLTIDEGGRHIPAMGEEEIEEMAEASELFEPGTTGRVIAMQNFVPIIATVVSYGTFKFLPQWFL